MDRKEIHVAIAKLMAEEIQMSDAPENVKVHTKNCALGIEINYKINKHILGTEENLKKELEVNEKLTRILEILDA